MGEKDVVGMGRIYDGIGRLGAWVSKRGGSELGRQAESVAAWVSEVGQ